MADAQTGQQADSSFWTDLSVRFRDLEEKNRILRERVLLIGQNLIETKEKNTTDLLEIKKELETIKKNMERLINIFGDS